MVLDMKKIALDELMQWLWEREGKPARERLKQVWKQRTWRKQRKSS
jgi:hypothetical protein